MHKTEILDRQVREAALCSDPMPTLFHGFAPVADLKINLSAVCTVQYKTRRLKIIKKMLRYLCNAPNNTDRGTMPSTEDAAVSGYGIHSSLASAECKLMLHLARAHGDFSSNRERTVTVLNCS